uniref:Uncharacterized protein n=1 Tax=Arundo donax TaxID=35708 RepID=A0A0A9GEG2_ARUDO
MFDVQTNSSCLKLAHTAGQERQTFPTGGSSTFSYKYAQLIAL